MSSSPLTCLKDREEDAEEMRHARVRLSALHFCIEHTDLGDVGTLRRPQRCTGQAEKDRGWIHQRWSPVQIGSDEGQIAKLTDDNRPLHAEYTHLTNSKRSSEEYPVRRQTHHRMG